MSSLAAGHIFGKGRPALPNRVDKGPAHGNLIEMLEQDRLRISQELHDDLGQRLALLEIHLTQIEERCPCPETARGISAVRDRIREMDRDVHRVCCQLYPVLLEKFGLVVALRALCRDFSQLGIRTDFIVDNCPRLSPSVSLCIYRVAQEALHNISKHSKAKYAKVSLRGSPRRIEIVVEDEGVGFDPSLIETTAGLGLASIEERVRRAGGRCFITSTPGAGTEVRAAFYTFIVVE